MGRDPGLPGRRHRLGAAQLTDDLLANGDLHEALQRMLNRGWRTPDGEQVQGLRDLLDQLRLEREEQLDRGDLGGAYREIAEELQQVLAEERIGIEQLEADARNSGDQRRQEVTEEVAAERRMQLDLLPSDLAGMVHGLQNYEFVSSEARQHFEELMERLREEVARTYFEQMSEALTNPDPAQLAHMREAFDALNRMIEQREAGEAIDPSFESFMEQYGDLFPGNPADLDELLSSWRPGWPPPRPCGTRCHPSSGPSSRGWPSRCSRTWTCAGRSTGWPATSSGPSPGPVGTSGSGSAATSPWGWAREPMPPDACATSTSWRTSCARPVHRRRSAEVDLDKVRRHLGDDAARSLDRLSKLAKQLADAGLIDQTRGPLRADPQGHPPDRPTGAVRSVRPADKDRVGNHRTTWTGTGHDREETTKPYEFGDPFNLDLSRTVHNAVRRAGSGVPVRLHPDDFEVIETEALTRSATVLLLDLSLSMPMRDNFVPAKKMAMALHTLISSRFPRDYLGLVGFSEVARVIEPEDLPTVSWDYVYGTNLQHGLILARKMLAHQQGTKQIILVTDGEPTAHVIPYEGGVGYDVYFNYPPVPETLEVTLAEVMRCTKAEITINTFLLDPDRGLQGFIEQLSRINRGRTFATSPDELGDYVLVDFLAHKTTSASPGSPGRLTPAPGPDRPPSSQRDRSVAGSLMLVGRGECTPPCSVASRVASTSDDRHQAVPDA